MLFLGQCVKREFLQTCARIEQGSLRLRTPEGEALDFGQGQPAAEMQVNDWSVDSAIAARGDVGLGETYVAGLWDTPSIEDLTRVALLNLERFQGYAYAGFWYRMKVRVVDRLLRANSRRGSARNIRAHYDVGIKFYQLWLDEGMTYSAAMFAPGDDDLGRAQNRKYDRILNRLGTGERVLEIGCGWGGFADTSRQVTALTLSPGQKGYADARLDGRAEIRLQDYRASIGQFDALVSIEMNEAVGEAYWPVYFATLKARLAEGGTAMIGDQAWRVGLVVHDLHGFGADCARTCAHWGARPERQSARLRKLGHGDAFVRNWRCYRGVCAASFGAGNTDVVQVELAHV